MYKYMYGMMCVRTRGVYIYIYIHTYIYIHSQKYVQYDLYKKVYSDKNICTIFDFKYNLQRTYVNTVTILFLDLVVKDYQLIEKIQDVFRFSNIIN